MKIYKIRSKKTGLFSGGGRCPNWTKEGKSWSSGKLTNHLYMFMDTYNKEINIPEDWEVVCYHIEEVSAVNAKECMIKYIQAMKEYKDQKKIGI